QADPAYLFKPQVATRVRLVTYDSMPFPPEVPSGENPPNGAILDYYLASDVNGPLKIDILDGAGKVVRTYESGLTRDVDPALDPAAYSKVCHANPHAPDCSIPLYWPAPTLALSTKAGMHRISWSMRYQPLAQERSEIRRPIVIPHRSSVVPSSPWAPPGRRQDLDPAADRAPRPTREGASGRAGPGKPALGGNVRAGAHHDHGL